MFEYICKVGILLLCLSMRSTSCDVMKGNRAWQIRSKGQHFFPSLPMGGNRYLKPSVYQGGQMEGEKGYRALSLPPARIRKKVFFGQRHNKKILLLSDILVYLFWSRNSANRLRDLLTIGGIIFNSRVMEKQVHWRLLRDLDWESRPHWEVILMLISIYRKFF